MVLVAPDPNALPQEMPLIFSGAPTWSCAKSCPCIQLVLTCP